MKRKNNLMNKEKKQFIIFAGLGLAILLFVFFIFGARGLFLKTSLINPQWSDPYLSNTKVWDSKIFDDFSCSGTLSSCLAKIQSPFSGVTSNSQISLEGLPSTFIPDYIYTYDVYGTGKYYVGMFDDTQIYWCGADFNPCSQGFLAWNGAVGEEPDSFNPTLIYTHDLTNMGKNTVVHWQNNVMYWCVGDEGDLGCVNGYKRLSNSTDFVQLPESFSPDRVEYNHSIKDFRIYQGTSCYRYDMSLNPAHFVPCTTPVVDPTLSNAKIWDSKIFDDLSCSGTLSSCLARIQSPFRGTTTNSQVSLTGYPSTFIPDYIYTYDIYGDGKYSVGLFDGDVVYWCGGDSNPCSSGFTLWDGNVGEEPNSFDPTLIYTHDLTNMGKDTVVHWQNNVMYWCVGDEGDLGCVNGYKRLSNSTDFVQLPESFSPDRVEYNDSTKDFRIYQGTSCYRYDMTLSTPHFVLCTTPVVDPTLSNAKIWDSKIFDDFSCSGTLSSCLAKIQSPFRGTTTNSQVSLSGIPNNFVPDYIYTYDVYGDGKYSVGLYDDDVVYWCGGESNPCSSGFTLWDGNVGEEPNSFDPTLIYTHDLTNMGKDTVVHWQNNVMYWCVGDGGNQPCTNGFYRLPNSTDFVQLPESFAPDRVEYNDSTKDFRIYQGTTCYRYDMSLNPAHFVPCETPATNCAERGKNIVQDNIFDLRDINELAGRLVGIKSGSGVDINEDGSFSFADIISLSQCKLCMWDWPQCQ